MVAIRSAPIPCGTKAVSYAVSGSIAHAPPSEPIGTRDIDSTPPARTRSSQPEATFCAAMLTASRPEAQKRLSWTPATVFGRPALIAAVLAMSAPWSPIGVTQPRTTSSIRVGSSCPLRASTSCISPTTRSTGLVACSEPLLLPFPRGVRTASNTSASVAAIAMSPQRPVETSKVTDDESALRNFGAISRSVVVAARRAAHEGGHQPEGSADDERGPLPRHAREVSEQHDQPRDAEDDQQLQPARQGRDVP